MTVGELIEYLKGEKPDARVMILDRIETDVPKQISEVHTLRNIGLVILKSETREEYFRHMREAINDFQKKEYREGIMIQTYKTVVTTLVFIILLLMAYVFSRDNIGASGRKSGIFMAVLYVLCVVGMWL